MSSEFPAENCYQLNDNLLTKLAIILRLSVLLTQQRQHDDNYQLQIKAEKHVLKLTLDTNWLNERPIIDTELYFEAQILKQLGYQLNVDSAFYA